MTFHDLGLTEDLCAVLERSFHIDTPLSIQKAAFAPLFQGESALICQHTGSGKTLAYLLPLLMKVDPAQKNNQLLIVAPTQELAVQIGNVAEELLTALSPLSCEVLIGGANIRYQIERLRLKPALVIGTPGRLLELFKSKKLNGQTIFAVVYDEIDELLSNGGEMLLSLRKSLLRDVQQVAVTASAEEKTHAFFAAQGMIPKPIGEMGPYLNPKIRHHLYLTGGRRKNDVLIHLLHALANDGRTLVFLNQPDQIERTLTRLRHANLKVAALYAHMNKEARKRTITDFRSGETTVLLASDLSARGLDFPEVTQVVHMDFPKHPRTYLHRAGRTARGNGEGDSIVISDHREEAALRIYARTYNIHFSDMHVADGKCYAGLDPDGFSKSSASKKGSARGQGNINKADHRNHANKKNKSTKAQVERRHVSPDESLKKKANGTVQYGHRKGTTHRPQKSSQNLWYDDRASSKKNTQHRKAHDSSTKKGR